MDTTAPADRAPRATAIVALVVMTALIVLVVMVPQRSLGAESGCAPVTVRSENARLGGVGWQLPPAPADPTVQGFASATSVTCGGRIDVGLGTLSRAIIPVRIQAWRLGYYGGLGGRLVWTSPVIGVRRPRVWSHVTHITHVLTAPWPVTTPLEIPDSWPQGVYVLKIAPVRRSLTGGEIPLVVRDSVRVARYTEVVAVNTLEMYNAWGGWSAYSQPRSRIVSFNRPYSVPALRMLFENEYPLVRYAEQLGLDIGYVTDVDLDAGGAAFTRSHALLFASHSEYWTTAMRANLEAGLARGVNAVFFGANNMYWRPVPLGQWHQYRELAIYRLPSLDPYANDPSRASLMWRQAPISRPEQTTLGEQYGCDGVLEPMTVPSPSLGWMFAGSRATPGQVLPGVNYGETDLPDPNIPAAPGTQIVTQQTFACPRQRLVKGGAAITLVASHGAGGGLVIDMGTTGWLCHLDQSCAAWPFLNLNGPVVDGVVQDATRTILTTVGAGPAGHVTVADPYPALVP